MTVSGRIPRRASQETVLQSAALATLTRIKQISFCRARARAQAASFWCMGGMRCTPQPFGDHTRVMQVTAGMD